MNWKILVSAPYMLPVLDNYREVFHSKGAELVIPPVKERLGEDELLEIMGDIDGVIAGDDRFTRNVIKKSVPKLKVISKWGTGIDSFDQEACREMGVAIRNTPGAFTEPVADSVLGYILSFSRKLPWMDRQMKAGEWDKIPGTALHESVLGIIGFGRIGQAVAKRARAFGMRVLVNDILEIPAETVSKLKVEPVRLDDLLRNSDFVSINCDLNPSSYHLLNSKGFNLMKSNAVVINLARGPIIVESALVDAMESRKIGGAAMDVFEDEPLPDHSRLRALSNVMLAPHNSNSSPAAWLHVHQNTIKNLFEVLSPS